MTIGLGTFFPCARVAAQNRKFYFYHGYPFGSEATYNPISITINGGYGILLMGNRAKNPFTVDYRTGWRNVRENITHPIREVKIYGWKHFVTTEIFPTSLVPRSAQYLPNYQNHLIGGGMTYRMFREWYVYHGYPQSTILALSTLTVYHVLNEVVENNNYAGTNVDPIADILVFNPLGVLLFSDEGVVHFFAERLQLRDWSYFPTINPLNGNLENIGQNFAIKWRLPRQQTWSLFYNFGLNGIVGLSYRRKDGTSISAGAGLMARNLRRVQRDDGVRSLTADLAWNVGIFYDRDGSLMASFLVSGSRAYKMRTNLYPGLIRIGNISPGIFTIISRKNEVIFGMTLRGMPLGLAFQE
ncbi:MAG: hypothetical protein ONB44_14180 [candidate division KSB1 bacterium]|nr:hypothetical protein [candidate division KSB1 bacterium]